MALPTIPTSFVPRASSSGGRHIRDEAGSVFGFFAYALLGIAFLLAIGVFFYGRLLAMNLASENAALATAESSIDPATVESFVQLRDRLDSSKSLLAKHISLSGFFSTLETILPATVRFSTLDVTVDTTGSVAVTGTGVSKSFNALSAASVAFASDGRIKNVIFSKMNINKDSSVSFNFSATVDPKLLVFSPDEQSPVVPQESVTSTTTPNNTL